MSKEAVPDPRPLSNFCPFWSQEYFWESFGGGGTDKKHRATFQPLRQSSDVDRLLPKQAFL